MLAKNSVDELTSQYVKDCFLFLFSIVNFNRFRRPRIGPLQCFEEYFVTTLRYEYTI